MSVREASKAGAWYAADPFGLARELDDYLARADVAAARPLLAAVVPHAGLAFSGPTAARAYAWIRAAMPSVDTFLVFGAVHTMPLMAPAVWAQGAWETPLGALEIDGELAAALVEAGVGDASEAPHRGDNAIELQTPFLKHCFPAARFVPLAVPPNDHAAAAGEAAWQIVSQSGKTVVAVGSTDLTHYGADYGFAPAGSGTEAHAWSLENDRKLLRLMESLDAEAVVPRAKSDRSACGAGAVAASVACARAGGCPGGVVLEHTTSHEVMPRGDPDMFVGYAAVVFPAA